MSDGRTVWWSKDAAWWRREWLVELGEEFGSAGPAVIDWLSCEAKAQNAGGWVKTGPRSIARGCFVDSVTVGHVLSRSVTLGLLDEFTDDGGRFSCRMSGWQSDQERAQAAGRKAKQRAVALENKGDLSPESRSVTPSHGESRPVTECPPTGQDRTVVPASQVTTHAMVECFDYWRERCNHPNAKFTQERKRVVRARFDEKYTVQNVRQGIDGAAKNPPRDRDSGVVHDDLMSICRNGAQLERYMARATAEPSDRVVPIHDEKRDRQARRLAALHRITNNGGDAA